MDDSEIAFWSTAAQLTVVLTLALVVEFRSTFRRRDSPRTAMSERVIATIQVVSASAGIAAAFIQCLVALSSATSSSAAINAVSWTLVVSFTLLVFGPVSDVVRHIWRRPKSTKRKRTATHLPSA